MLHFLPFSDEMDRCPASSHWSGLAVSIQKSGVSDFFGRAIAAGSVTLRFRFWCVSKMHTV